MTELVKIARVLWKTLKWQAPQAQWRKCDTPNLKFDHESGSEFPKNPTLKAIPLKFVENKLKTTTTAQNDMLADKTPYPKNAVATEKCLVLSPDAELVSTILITMIAAKTFQMWKSELTNQPEMPKIWVQRLSEVVICSFRIDATRHTVKISMTMTKTNHPETVWANIKIAMKKPVMCLSLSPEQVP